MVDHHVDRLDVEAQQCVQLTSTNSSIGLIYALKKFLNFNFTVQLLNYIYVQKLNIMSDKEEYFQILRKIQNNKKLSQRDLASELGFLY